MEIEDYRYNLPPGESPGRGEHDFLHDWFDEVARTEGVSVAAWNREVNLIANEALAASRF